MILFDSACRTTFRIPRNAPGCIYMLPPQISRSEAEWLSGIELSAEKYLTNQHNLNVTGPVLVITDSILKAEKAGIAENTDVRICYW